MIPAWLHRITAHRRVRRSIGKHRAGKQRGEYPVIGGVITTDRKLTDRDREAMLLAWRDAHAKTPSLTTSCSQNHSGTTS